MKVNFIKKTKRELEIEVEGEGHSLFNALRKVLFEDNSVIFAGYHIKHPMIGKTVFMIKTDGNKTAKDALTDAINNLRGKIGEFREKFLEVKDKLSA